MAASTAASILPEISKSARLVLSAVRALTVKRAVCCRTAQQGEERL